MKAISINQKHFKIWQILTMVVAFLTLLETAFITFTIIEVAKTVEKSRAIDSMIRNAIALGMTCSILLLLYLPIVLAKINYYVPRHFAIAFVILCRWASLLMITVAVFAVIYDVLIQYGADRIIPVKSDEDSANDKPLIV